jgi:hypothetical protein
MPVESLPVEFLYTIHLDTGAPVMVTNGPAGTKVIAPVVGGSFEGPRVRGAVVAPGGDWVTVGAEGQMTLDVRLCLRTDDGASIYCSYRGLLLRGEGGARALAAPLFETGDERYTWLNRVQAIGVGTAGAGGVDYEIYALK